MPVDLLPLYWIGYIVARQEGAMLRAVRDGRAFATPTLSFGWLDDPPSINRLLGFAWLGGSDPQTLAAQFNAVVYGRALTAARFGR